MKYHRQIGKLIFPIIMVICPVVTRGSEVVCVTNKGISIDGIYVFETSNKLHDVDVFVNPSDGTGTVIVTGRNCMIMGDTNGKWETIHISGDLMALSACYDRI